jgi:hypothetical protein
MEIINFGYSYRDIPKLSQAPKGYVTPIDLRSRARAGWLTMSQLYKPLCTYVRTTPIADVIAPTCLVSPRGTKELFSFEYEEAALSTVAEGSAHLKSLWLGAYHRVPSEWSMQEHNEMRAFYMANTGLWKERDVISSRVFTWASCVRVAGWIQKNVLAHRELQIQLQYDPLARARVRGWYSQLRAYANIHARVVFLFEQIEHP